MNLLIKDRAKGKTTSLIYTSATMQYPIVVSNRYQIDYVKQMAKELGCIIPEPLCILDFIGDSCKERKLPENVLLDDAASVIEEALKRYLHTNVVAATMTDRIKERYEYIEKYK